MYIGFRLDKSMTLNDLGYEGAASDIVSFPDFLLTLILAGFFYLI